MPATRLRPCLAVLAATCALLAAEAGGGPAHGGSGDAAEVATPGAERAAGTDAALVDLAGRPADPFAEGAAATVLLFVRTDCPISNRYAPEVRRIRSDFAGRGVSFHLVYADPTEPVAAIRGSLDELDLTIPALRDPEHRMVARVGATVTPEVAVFDGDRRLVYRGRIDDRWASLGRPRAAPTRRDLAEVLAALVEGERLEPRTTRAVGCFIPELEEEPAGSDARP